MDSVNEKTSHGFYGMDIGELRSVLEDKAWVASAHVSRVWPSRIAIKIQEHEPAARWNDDHLISKQLVLFKPHQLDRQSPEFDTWSEVFRPLPLVIGAHGRHQALLDAYRAYDDQLSRFGLSLALLDEDERLSQTLVLSNKVTVKLGLEQRELRMQRFIDVYERIATNATASAIDSASTSEGPLSFDMRYTNGFALGVADTDDNRQPGTP